jgi:hypothetical protein
MAQNEIASFEMKVNYVKPEVGYNLTELDLIIDKIKKQYKDSKNQNNGVIIVDENSYTSAKKDRAKLNTSSKAINDKKIEISKIISEPIKTFESEIKKRIEEIKSLSDSIDIEIKAYEDKQEKQKETEIKALPDYADFTVFNEKWLQKTYEFKTIEEEIKAQKLVFQSNCRAVEMTCQAYGINKEKYYNMLIEKKTVEEVMTMIENDVKVIQANKSLSNTVCEPKKTIFIDTSGDKYTKTFTVKGSKSQLISLKEFMEQTGIEIVK